MAISMVELKRKNWISKLQHTKKQVLGRSLAIFSRVLSCRKKQERNEKNPRCSETTLAIIVQPTSSENPNCAVEIPEDLVEEILHRLPVKTLVRLKSVSKEWKSLVESNHLAVKHLRLLEKKYGVVEEMKITVEWSISRNICIKFFSKSGDMRSSYINKEGPLQVAGSCDGLVCIYQLDHLYVYVFNPMTGVTRTLTPPPDKKLSVGFGRDVVTGTYKVVVLYSFDRVETLVFDLDTGMWRRRYKTAGPMPLSCTPNPEINPVFVNGSLFWLMASDISKILVLDLHTEEFRTVSQPNENNASFSCIYMWSLEDRLCVNNCRKRMNSEVWVLMQNKLSERWERSIRFDLLGIFPPLPLYSAWFSQTLVSPYQSLSTRFGSRQRQSSTSVQFSGNRDTKIIDAPLELHLFLNQ